MPEVIEVQFKGNRKAYFAWSGEPRPAVGDDVLVTVERGRDLGRVSAVGDVAERKCAIGCAGCGAGDLPDPSGIVLRAATDDERHVSRELRKAEDDVRRTVIERVRSHELRMKVSDAEWQWDRKKLTIYFTADRRVDFRALVRDLASLFRTRIELRQIGARDEAKRLTGVGRCGREYCCSSWLPELKPVSLSLAKDQRLSLNPSQISGGCGRLLCCLRYEHEFYVQSRKRFPKEGRTITTGRGREKVVAVDIFRERVLLRAEDGATRAVVLPALKEEMDAARDAAAGRTAAAAPPAAPANLATFEEAGGQVTDRAAEQAVDPPRRRRRRRGRRGGAGRKRSGPTDDRSSRGDDDGPGG